MPAQVGGRCLALAVLERRLFAAEQKASRYRCALPPSDHRIFVAVFELVDDVPVPAQQQQRLELKLFRLDGRLVVMYPVTGW